MPKVIFESSENSLVSRSSGMNYWRGSGTVYSGYFRYLNLNRASTAHDFAKSGTTVDTSRLLDGNPTIGMKPGVVYVLDSTAPYDIGTTDMSISYWVYPDTLDATRRFIYFKYIGARQGGGFQEVGSSIWLTSTNWTCNVQYAIANFNDYTEATNTHGLSTGSWQHIAFTIKRSTNTIRYYLNGVYSNQATFGFDFSSYNITNTIRDFVVGTGSYTGISGEYDGNMADIFFQKELWTDSDVYQIYRNVKQG